MVGLAQRVVVAHGQAPRDAAVQNCLEYLVISIRILTSRDARSVVHFEGVLAEAAPFAAYALVHLDRQVSIVIDTPSRDTNSFV